MFSRHERKKVSRMIAYITEHPVWFFLILTSMVISFRIFFGLWLLPKHKEVRIVKRVFWSVVALVPFTGPFFFAAFYRIPKVHKNGGAPVNSAAFYGSDHL